MDFSKEQRAHVRKNVYSFKVTDNEGGSFSIDFSNYISKTLPMSDKLESLFNRITEESVTYVEQYFESKDESEKNGFKFEELNEKQWKNKK